MRYELAFAASGPAAPDRAAFERYFSKRSHWRVSRGKASYAHEETGVSFGFEYSAAGGAAGAARPWAIFSLELPRASFFAEEATRELGAFAAAFGPALAHGGGAAAYNVSDFLRNWEEATRAACAQLRAHAAPGQPPFTMPRARLLASWRWNDARRLLQQQEGDVFVPRVWYVRTVGGAGTCVIWPDALPVRVPQADLVIFSRDELAPRTRLGRRPDVAVAPWALITGAITGDAFFDHQLANWRVTDERVLKGVMRLVSKLRGTTEMPEFLLPDAVLDEEWFTPLRAAR